MSERTHSVPANRMATSKQKWALLVGGTAVAVLAAGVLFQVFRAERADAGAEPSEGAAEQAGTAHVSTSRGEPKYVARVNKQLIPYDVVAQECFKRIGNEVLDNIINRAIIQQACQKRGVVVTEAEVDQEITRIAQRFGLAVENWYQMLQAERNISPAQYRRDIIWPMLALKMLAGDDVTVTEEDLRQGFIRDYGPRVKAKMIMLDNYRRATDVWEKAVANPDDFGRLAREHSIDPTSRPLDGAIPAIRRYAGNENLEKAAFNLREGEVSGVIQVGLERYVILKCEGRTEQTVELEEVREDLSKHMREQKVQESVAKVFDKLKKEARVDNYLTNTSTGGVEATSATAPFGGVRPAGHSRPAAPAASKAGQPKPKARNLANQPGAQGAPQPPQ